MSVESVVQDVGIFSSHRRLRVQTPLQHIHHLPRSHPASGLRRQPELCQQAAEVVISLLRTKSPLA